jgi:two-component system chemotaxis response regulator CheB
MPTFDIVVIAASLGGPDAVRTVVAALPAEFPAAIVVVQHRAPESDEMTVALLRRHARSVVRLARDGERPSGGVIDVAPVGCQLVVGPNGAFALRPPAGKRSCRADPLLSSVADYYGPRAIGVILSGTQDDGSIGVCALKGKGGWVLAQDRASARSFGMPGAAIATGCVDHVLPLHRIADALVALTAWPGATELLRVPPPFWAPAVP